MDWLNILTSHQKLNFLAFLSAVGILAGILLHWLSSSHVAYIFAWLLIGWGGLLLVLIILSKGISQSFSKEIEQDGQNTIMGSQDSIQMEHMRRLQQQQQQHLDNNNYISPMVTQEQQIVHQQPPRANVYIVNESSDVVQPEFSNIRTNFEPSSKPNEDLSEVYHRAPICDRERSASVSIDVIHEVFGKPPEYSSLF